MTSQPQHSPATSSHATSNIFVIGGTGAQGIPIVSALVADKKYAVRVLSRDSTSPRAKALLELGNVSFLEGSFADEAILREGFRGCDGAFVNIDGFNAGEKTETYWAMRSYEIAIEEGIKFFVYGNLDYVLKKSGYDSRFRTGHYDGKGRVGEWILFQNQVNSDRMGAAVFTSGPYIEMVISPGTPMTPTVEDGVVTWRVPLGEGAVPHVALEDCGYYVRWLFDHPERANGMDLEVAIEHVTYANLAAAFEKVTGHPAQYIDTNLDTYWRKGPFSRRADVPAGYNADPNDKSTEFARTGLQGGLQWYRCATSSRFVPELQLFSGRAIDVPSCFIAGANDWGIYQSPGAMEAMQEIGCTDMRMCRFVEGAGHWVQQEQPHVVSALLLQFLTTKPWMEPGGAK